MCTTERENTPNGGKRDERKNGKADSGSKETDHRGGDRDERHHEEQGGEGRSGVFRNRAVQGHGGTERILHLERLGRGRQGMEVPEGRQHRGAGQRKMRAGDAGPHLRGHGTSAGACPAAPARRGPQ